MAYEQFATLYDDFMSHAPYDDWVQFTEEIMGKYQLLNRTLLDLGCGTGEITLRLKQLGYDITGVDISGDMLAKASEKSISMKENIQWIQQDLCDLNGFHNIDICISYCDVINYITTKADLQNVFQRVYNALSSDGAFIFDVHHLPYAEKELMNHTFSEITESLTYVWECEKGSREGEMYHFLTFFKELKNGYYERFDEEHHQFIYPKETYKILLEKAGFTKIDFYADFQLENDHLHQNCQRLFIIAIK